jgi:dipeptidyl aminopeptidase/acylaminoacyl peptidase
MDAVVMRQVAWLGDEWLAGKIRAVVLVFHGLGGGAPKQAPTTEEIEWARQGGLVVYPYYGPWSWMNRSSQRFVDELVDAVFREFSLDRKVPVISTGGSMGGQATLLYTRYAHQPIVACHALFPVCDVTYHFNERPDLPATFRYAYRDCKDDWQTILEEHSPLHQVDHMPRIPYQVIHGDADKAVSKEHHSDVFVAKMKGLGHNVEYIEVPRMGHGGPMPLDVLQRRIQFVSSYFA